MFIVFDLLHSGHSYLQYNRSVTAQVVASQLVTNNCTSTLRSASSGWRRVVFGRLDSAEVCACQCRLCWSKFASFEWGLIDVYLIQCLCIVLMFMVRDDVNIHRVRAVMWSDHPSLYQEAQSAAWGLEDQRILWQFFCDLMGLNHWVIQSASQTWKKIRKICSMVLYWNVLGAPNFKYFLFYFFLDFLSFVFNLWYCNTKKCIGGPTFQIFFFYFSSFIIIFLIFGTAIVKNVLGAPNFQYFLKCFFIFYYFLLRVFMCFHFSVFFHIFGGVATPCEWGTFEWAPSPYKWAVAIHPDISWQLNHVFTPYQSL